MLDQKAVVGHLFFSSHPLEFRFPRLSVGWIGKHKVELACRERVSGPGRAVFHVLGLGPLPFEDEIRLADIQVAFHCSYRDSLHDLSDMSLRNGDAAESTCLTSPSMTTKK